MDDYIQQITKPKTKPSHPEAIMKSPQQTAYPRASPQPSTSDSEPRSSHIQIPETIDEYQEYYSTIDEKFNKLFDLIDEDLTLHREDIDHEQPQRDYIVELQH